jgi:hypothetical protein
MFDEETHITTDVRACCTSVHFPSQILIELSNKIPKRCKCEYRIIPKFYIFLTLDLRIILVNDQLDAQFLL